MGTTLKGAATPAVAALASLPLVAAALFALPWGLVLLAAVALATATMGRFFLSRLPGLTGDCYGATCEVVEMLVLLLAVPLATALT